MGAAAFMDDADGQCLIPGLPDHLSSQRILNRISWWDYESALRVSQGWRSAVHQQSTIRKKNPHSNRLLGCIHPKKPKLSQQHHQLRNMAISICNPRQSPVSWETLPPIPGLACGAPLSGRCVSINSKVYVIGGRDPHSWEFISDTFMLDLLHPERSWQRLAPMSTPRSAFACVASGGKIFVAGGQGDEVLTLSSAEVYDIDTNSWEALPDLNIPRTECNAAVIGDRIFVIGGYSSSCCDSATGESESFCSELDDDGGATFWVSSADAISVGAKCWETVEELGPAEKTAWEIGSGIVQSVDKSALSGFLSRCSTGGEGEGDGDGWTIVDGKVICSRRSGGGGGGEEEELMLLAAASGREEVYACSCALDSSVLPAKVKVSFYRGVTDDGETSRPVVNWERVECPFELSRYGASCFLV